MPSVPEYVTQAFHTYQPRQQELNRILYAIASTDDSRRMSLLLETLRIVRNNLPFCFGENDESELIADLAVKEAFRATINRHTVTRAIVELYCSSQGGAVTISRRQSPQTGGFIGNDVARHNLKKKYLGLRVCFINNQWKYESILLGTRCFEPLYGERSKGYRLPFKRWIIELLQNFSLNTSHFFGATTDAGPDVKWMMRTGLSLKWCGVYHISPMRQRRQRSVSSLSAVPPRIGGDRFDFTNRETVYAIRSNESMGSLFAELCEQPQLGGATQLLTFKEHRFLGLTRVIRRILQTWEALETTSKGHPSTINPPQDFPLADDKTTLLQLLALLDPITTLNTRAQVKVLIKWNLYRIRLSILDETVGIKDRLLYFSIA
ncbi:Ribonuclease H-like domain [Phytophthora cactorum]|nr:Ribonuclease H-like domain [Phytophthora cactorum]